MTHIRVPTGPDYTQRMRAAVQDAPEGATICIPCPGVAADVVKARNEVCPGKQVLTKVESGWEPYRTLPELRTSIAAYDHDLSSDVALTLSVATALDCEGYEGFEPGEDHLYCEETGTLIVCRPKATTPEDAAQGLLDDGVTNVLFVAPGMKPSDQPDIPLLVEGRPAAIAYLPPEPEA